MSYIPRLTFVNLEASRYFILPTCRTSCDKRETSGKRYWKFICEREVAVSLWIGMLASLTRRNSLISTFSPRSQSREEACDKLKDKLCKCCYLMAWKILYARFYSNSTILSFFIFWVSKRPPGDGSPPDDPSFWKSSTRRPWGRGWCLRVLK